MRLFRCLLLLLGMLGFNDRLSAQTPGLAPPPADVSEALSVPGENLIPAALGVRTDKKGHSWNVEKNGTLGRIGSTMVNSGLILSVNREKFETFQPRMTKDGKEYVIHGRPIKGLAGVEVTRRIRFVEESGALRYLELFSNSAATPVTIDIELATSFSGNYQTSVTDRANIEPVLLGERETGLIVTPGSSQANRAFLFVLCGPQAPDKPTVSAQNRYGLRFQYSVTLQPGEIKAFAHVVSQAIVPQEFDRKTLGKLFAPFSLEKIQSTIPEKFKEVVVNRSSGRSHEGLLTGIDSVESLGIEESETDVLAMGAQSRLFGKATFQPLEMETAYGKATIPIENVRAVVGKNQGQRDLARVFLKDGQILSGELPGAELSFAVKSGNTMKLSIDKLDRLVLAEKGPQAAPLHAMIQTWSGDQMILKGDNNLLFFGLTPWGDFSFTLDNLYLLQPAADDLPGYEVQLNDGSHCIVYLSGRELLINSGILGNLTVNFNMVRAIIPAQGRKISPVSTRIQLVGNQEVNGKLAVKEIALYSNGQEIVVKTDEIRRLVSRSSLSGGSMYQSVMAEMWDNSRIEGIVRASLLEVNVEGKVWKIPFSDIIEINGAGPSLNGENRGKVSALLVQLGDESWSVREKATGELAKFGFPAIPMLKTEMNKNPDPEVRRRIERVLSDFKEK